MKTRVRPYNSESPAKPIQRPVEHHTRPIGASTNGTALSIISIYSSMVNRHSSNLGMATIHKQKIINALRHTKAKIEKRMMR